MRRCHAGVNTAVYDGSTLTPCPDPFDDTSGSWSEILASRGWHHRAGHLTPESSFVTVDIWVNSERNEWMIDVMMREEGLMLVFCTDVMSMVKFLRDWVKPLIDMQFTSFANETLEAVHANLFDPQNGLQCVRRVAQSDRLMRMRYADERRKREEAKNASTIKN